MRLRNKKKSFFLNRLKAKHQPLLFRRLAFLWVFLIIVEIGCPLLNCESFAAELKTGKSAASNSIMTGGINDSPNTSPKQDFISQDIQMITDGEFIADHQTQDEDCNDECLCHITPLNVLVFVMPKHFQQTPVSPLKLKFQPSSDLPPPYQPPQFS